GCAFVFTSRQIRTTRAHRWGGGTDLGSGRTAAEGTPIHVQAREDRRGSDRGRRNAPSRVQPGGPRPLRNCVGDSETSMKTCVFTPPDEIHSARASHPVE